MRTFSRALGISRANSSAAKGTNSVAAVGKTPIAKGILGGLFTGGHTITVDVVTEGEALKLRFQQSEPAKLPVLV